MVGIVRAYSHFGAIGVELQYSHGLFPIYLTIYIYLLWKWSLNDLFKLVANYWIIIKVNKQHMVFTLLQFPVRLKLQYKLPPLYSSPKNLFTKTNLSLTTQTYNWLIIYRKSCHLTMRWNEIWGSNLIHTFMCHIFKTIPKTVSKFS